MLYRFCFLDAHDRTVTSEEIEVGTLLISNVVDAPSRPPLSLRENLPNI